MSKRRQVGKWLVMGSCCLVVGMSGFWRLSATAPVHRSAVAHDARAERQPEERVAVPARTLLQVAATPLHFERNDGQGPSGVRFLARGAGYSVLLSDADATIVLANARDGSNRDGTSSSVVRARFAGASTPTAVTGEAALAGTINYFRGNDPSRWQQGVPTFGRVRAAAVYPGIDAVYYGNQRQLQYDFEIAPHADPSRIALAFDGADRLEVDDGGNLLIHVAGRVLRQQRPFSYQDGPNGRQEIWSRFVIDEGRNVRFALGAYDPQRMLVIDPVVSYSSYFGGDSEETAYDVALGPGGSVYVTGITADLPSLPTLGAFQPGTGGQPDAFIAKFEPLGDSLSLVFSSYLGGTGQENNGGYGYTGDIAVDAAGTAHLTGPTGSADFPVTSGAHDPTFGGNNMLDAYYARVSSTGALLYATYLGGTGTDVGSGIALGPGGTVYIFGFTSSDHLTEQSPVTTNAYDQTMDGGSDAFVARYTAAGALDYFTFLGGNGGEASFYNGAIDVDAAGNVYVAADSSSGNDFLAPVNGFDTTLGNSSSSGFFVKLDTTRVGAAQALYKTYITGTNGQLWAYGVAATDTGLAYIVGETSTSAGFPIKGAVQPTYQGGNRDAYLIKVDTNQTGGNSLIFGTYLGGDQSEAAHDVAIDALGRAVVVGTTNSTSPQVVAKFPLVQQVASCPTFVRLTPFVTVLAPAGTAVDFSTCYASSRTFNGVAVSPAGDIWAVGSTNDVSTNPPTATGVPLVNPEQATYGRGFPGSGGDADALIVRISPSTDMALAKTAGPNPVLPGQVITFTLTITNTGTEAATGVVVSDPLPATLAFVSCTATNGGTCGVAGNAITVTYGTVAAGASSAITIAARVSEAVGAATAISNTATVTSTTRDSNLANNSATAQVSTPTLTPTGDADTDGLTNEFETRYGLNPFSQAGGNGPGDDPDADGRTNLQEQQDGTHPRGFVITYLAEGATTSFFETRLAIANPTLLPALVATRFQKADGTTIRDYRVVPPMRRTTIDVKDLAGLEFAEFSTLIEADVQVVADRTMTWGNGFGSHAERGILTRTATKWYFAEGATFGNFNLFYLIQNPNTQAAQVRVTYLLPSGPPLVKDYVVNPQSRFNIWVDNEGLTDPTLAALASAELSAIIESTNGVPIIAERAMYLDQPGRVFGAGHESAGVTAPSTHWFLAEGATGNYFDEFILIANPQASTATVQADFLLSNGQVITKNYTVGGNSRFNIWVDLEDPRLADAAVSTRITSTNDVPIIVERAMWWPGPTSDTWQEAHNSPGEVTTGTRWAIAEGEIGGPRNIETYVLIANASSFDGTARVTVLFEDGTPSVVRTFPLTANSRSNVAAAADFPETVGKRFGMLIESIGTTPAQIVVERAMYSDAEGVRWAAGTNALATKLQ